MNITSMNRPALAPTRADRDLARANRIEDFRTGSSGEIGVLDQVELRNLHAQEDWTPAHEQRLTSLMDGLDETLSRRQARRARVQLQEMKEQGILLDSDSQNATCLDNIEQLMRQPLGERMDRRRLLESTLNHLHDPTTISQGEQGSCVSASVQHQLAEQQPAEYTRLLLGLASPSGQVVTQKGETLIREPDSHRRPGRRDLASVLLQDAFTEFANGPESYDARADHSSGDHDPTLHQANPYMENSGHMEGGHPGLYPEEVRRLAQGVLSGRFSNVYVEQGKPSGALERIEGALSREGSAFVGLQWERGGHRLAVVGIEQDRVYLWNPWGEDGGHRRNGGPERQVEGPNGLISLSRETFQERLQTYVVSDH